MIELPKARCMTSIDRLQGWQAASWHRTINHIQTTLLVLMLIAISALAGSLLFGDEGLWIALGAGILALIVEPAAASMLTLKLYHARPIHPDEAPALWGILRELATRAHLTATPIPHVIPSSMVNAFATGSKHHSAIVLTDSLLHSLTPRELAGVIGHEIAHIANEDLRVMGLADYISRLTNLLALIGQTMVLFSLPAVLLIGTLEVNWFGLLLLSASPHLALLAQLGLSRVREFDADHLAAQLTGDPVGLASALAKIERVNRSWRAWLIPGWGNPEPSWLRSHPAIHDRIVKLLELTPQLPMTPESQPIDRLPIPQAMRSPRWHLGGGLWH